MSVNQRTAPTAAERTVVVGGARTPFGMLLGALSGFSAAELGGFAIQAALERCNVPADAVDHVIMGQVLTAGAGQIPARQAATFGGLSMNVPATNINKVCLSGIAAIADADRMIRAGAADIVIAGGMESMSQAPHLLPSSRVGNRYGDFAAVDSMKHDGLWDSYTDQSMGALTDEANARLGGYTRQQQDEYALMSHQRAVRARRDGIFDREIAAVKVPQRRGEPETVSEDEAIRDDINLESLAKLRPAFGPDGTITAGSASPISDGAAVVILMSRRKAEELGLFWIAEIGASSSVAGPDSALQHQPARAIEEAAAREGLTPADFDFIEINEAFAAVALASTRALNVSSDKVNSSGGALALGHPIGASGARVVLHIALQLGLRGSGVGVAALCGGGGQGDAMILHAPSGLR
ncbi:acetyl-CoA C-acetyltransferase [Arthrobacter sp. V1I7]|uniref:acetyl-CoA C-acetyltransferase n=1 Tax=Arthrobacter sp. V1I7 TaxID=3042274 RepID=UPI0027839184|nr:acetyl-CoA C-acetyltransferase [Arthrobacter sp. V1I7]MDQ0823753.1 acetyl-CoA C-acetyltransferase [Arthrobacter sp. V1I7]